MTKRRRRLIVNGVFFVVMVALLWVIGWWAILAGFAAGVIVGAVLPVPADRGAE